MATTSIKRLSLFDISDDLLALYDLITEAAENNEQTLEQRDPESNAQSEAMRTLEEWFTTLVENRDTKLDNYAAFCKELKTRVEVRKGEIERLERRNAVDLNTVKTMNERMRMFFLVQNLKSVTTKRFKVTLSNNGGVLPMILADPDKKPEQYPVEYHIPRIDLNTALIRKELTEGKTLEFAQLGERGQHIRIS